MKHPVLNSEKKEVGEVELADHVFGVAPNKMLIYETLNAQLANRRRGTSSTKDVGTVSGSTAKIYRQKGTGRARHGSKKRNIFVGGAIAFGPKTRDWSVELPKKMKTGGIRSAVSLKREEGKLLILDQLSPKEFKTKKMVEVLKNLNVAQGLIVIDGNDEKLEKSLRNIPGVKLLRSEELNVADLIQYEHLVMLQNVLPKVEERLKS